MIGVEAAGSVPRFVPHVKNPSTLWKAPYRAATLRDHENLLVDKNPLSDRSDMISTCLARSRTGV